LRQVLFVSFVLCGVILLLGTGFADWGKGNLGLSGALQIKVCTDQNIYHINTPVALAITVYTIQDTKATFNSGQIFDLLLEKDGQIIWQWSDGKMFTQSIVTQTIKANEPLIFCEVLNPEKVKLEPGKYKLTPKLCFSSPKTGSPVFFEVR
jgi:hypothetical protein